MRRNCSTIVEPCSRRHSQTRSMNASRPSSSCEVPSSSSACSTFTWVPIPAWSVPKIHFARLPCIRAWRMHRSWIERVQRVAHVQRAR